VICLVAPRSAPGTIPTCTCGISHSLSISTHFPVALPSPVLKDTKAGQKKPQRFPSFLPTPLSAPSLAFFCDCTNQVFGVLGRDIHLTPQPHLHGQVDVFWALQTVAVASRVRLHTGTLVASLLTSGANGLDRLSGWGPAARHAECYITPESS